MDNRVYSRLYIFHSYKHNSMRTRFAPSPTGHLHLGHAWSALISSHLSDKKAGDFLLRIEDIDAGRCRPEFISSIYQDLGWLGLTWPTPVRRQSEHFADYSGALQTLNARGVLYHCFCTRKEIQDEINRSATAPHGPEGAIYPGTCRHLKKSERDSKMDQGLPYAMRLDVEKALKLVSKLTWNDRFQGKQIATPQILGDVVLARKGVSASYHLCVTVDDNLQGVSLVTRGDDLFYATHLHRLLQELLRYEEPEWAHHPLLLDSEGKRFAKRNTAITLRSLRESQSKTPEDIIQMIRNSLPDHGPWQRLLMHI